MINQQPPTAQQGQQAQPYPQPTPPVPPSPSPYDPFQGPSAVPPATPAPPLQGPAGGGGAGFAGPPQGGNFNNWGPNEKNFYGGQQIAGADPSQADYGSVQTYADAALQNARRYLDPQQAAQNRRLEQTLINKGVDPNSAAGQEMAATLGRQQADANNAAAFGALQFGQGIQNQMAQQELANQQLAGQMQQALWGQQGQAANRDLQWGLGQLQNQLGMAGLANQRYGQDLQYQLGRSGQDLQRYGMDLQNQLGMGQLDMARQGQDWQQMMGLQDRDFQYQQYNDMLQRGDERYQDQLLMSLLNFNKPGGASQIDPTGFGQALMGSAGQDRGLLGALFG